MGYFKKSSQSGFLLAIGLNTLLSLFIPELCVNI